MDFFEKKQRQYIISETDLTMALDYLKQDKMAYASKMPHKWSRTLLIKHINEAIAEQSKPELDDAFLVTYQVWGHVVPVGVDLVRYPHQVKTWQIVLSIRNCNTDPVKFVMLDATQKDSVSINMARIYKNILFYFRR